MEPMQVTRKSEQRRSRKNQSRRARAASTWSRTHPASASTATASSTWPARTAGVIINAFGPALGLNDNASFDTVSVSTNGSVIDLLNLNRYPDPYALSLIRIYYPFPISNLPIRASTVMSWHMPKSRELLNLLQDLTFLMYLSDGTQPNLWGSAP